MSGQVVVRRAGPDEADWDEVLALVLRAFAYMDGRIDPPSSALKLTTEGLREKAGSETCFLAMNVTPTPNPSPQGGGGFANVSEPPPPCGEGKGGGDVSAKQTLVGCAFLSDRVDHAYLGKLAIDPAWQGKGIGKSLLTESETLARALGRSAIELQTRVELAENHAAFARLGFREIARTAHPGFKRPTSITMRKEL